MVSSAFKTKLSDSYSLLSVYNMVYRNLVSGAMLSCMSTVLTCQHMRFMDMKLCDCRNTVTWILLLVARSE